MTTRSGPINVIGDDTVVPVCPHCSARVSEFRARRLNAIGTGTFTFGKRYVYLCPDCHAVLAVSHRKGFWMG